MMIAKLEQTLGTALNNKNLTQKPTNNESTTTTEILHHGTLGHQIGSDLFIW